MQEQQQHQPQSQQPQHTTRFHSNRASLAIIKGFLCDQTKDNHNNNNNHTGHTSHSYLIDSSRNNNDFHFQFDSPSMSIEVPPITTFRPYLRERDSLGRLMESIDSPLSPRFQLDGIQGDIYKFRHSPSLKQSIRDGVELEEAKRRVHAKNTFGEQLKSQKKKNDALLKSSEESVQNTHISMDRFSLILPRQMTLASTRSNATRPINSSTSLFLSNISPRSGRGGGIEHSQMSLAPLLSPKKYSLVDAKKKDTTPGIGEYDIFNKDSFTFRKQQNTILPPHKMNSVIAAAAASSLNAKKPSEPSIRSKENKKNPELEKEKLKQQQQLEETTIVFPKLNAKNKYFLAEQQQINDVQKLQLKPLDEDDNFPLEFSMRMQEVKQKAKRIKEAIVHWTDAAAYHRRQKSVKEQQKQGLI